MDNPDVEHLLSLFLGRAIVDEVLPPKFLTAVLPFLENKSLGVDIVQATGTPSIISGNICSPSDKPVAESEIWIWTSFLNHHDFAGEMQFLLISG